MGRTQTFLAVGLTAMVACGGDSDPLLSDAVAELLVAQTTSGELSGAWADETAGVAVFRGIRFAQPPVGDLRWRPPAPVPSWEGISRHRSNKTIADEKRKRRKTA